MNSGARAEDPRHRYQICGLVRDAKSRRGLDGYGVTAFDVSRKEEFDLLGRTFTLADGSFQLRYARQGFVRALNEETREGGPDVLLRVTNRFGHEIAAHGPLAGSARFAELIIDVEAPEEFEHPAGPPRIDPFDQLRDKYRAELKVLREAGISDRGGVLSADLSAVAQRSGVPLERLEALRLHTEMGHARGFRPEVATALAAAGFKTREQLATAKPFQVVNALREARVRRITPHDYSPSVAYGWVGYAKGADITPFTRPIDEDRVLADSQRVIADVLRANPGALIEAVKGLLNPFNRLQAMASVRALMESAGVADLSALGTFWISGNRVIRPGYYIANPLMVLAGTEIGSVTKAILQRGAGFKHLKSANALPDALHLVPNPVTDAVIIGSVVEFVEGGRLIIGHDVSSLTIITEEIRRSVVNEITYENKERAPQARPPFSPPRAPTGSPDNDPNAYSPGDGNTGRSGGDGPVGATGAVGFSGDSLGAAPDVTIYVLGTPEGMPDVRLGGRRGGAGQHGQHGGDGGDGARGREASSGACRCWRGVGNGGNGGNGGRGGDGGAGGAGGSGASLRIVTLDTNILPLTSTRPFLPDVSGGPGGNGGSPGLGGRGGRGGAPGDDSWPWCDHEPSRVGADGSDGSSGARGSDGPTGPDGAFTLQPIILSDWHAVFNQPWIVRLEPWFGPAGTAVHLVARNITSDTVVLLDSQVIVPSSINVAGGTLDFVAPVDASGGERAVQLRLMGTSDFVYSNSVSFRVTPTLANLSPDNGVPGTIVTLTGTGFSNGAQVRFAGSLFPATFVSGAQLTFTLPDHENILVGDGDHEIIVINPDGRTSNPLTFALTLDIVVRVKAWRVFPDFWIGGSGLFGGPGPDRDEESVRDIFEVGDTAGQVWVPHHITLQFDHNVGIASVPADWASSWPIDIANVFAENEAVIKATDASGNYLHFEEGAVNFYFVDDIDDWTTHAYTFRGSVTTRREFVIYEDTPLLSGWEEAHVAAHELGHIFGLPHCCGTDGDETFGRDCTEGSDVDYLMYPSTNLILDEGNTLTANEAITARRVARPWHNL